MTFSMGAIKQICKEKNYAFRAASLFGISKNDSGRCDFYVETADAYFAVKVFSTGADAQRVYFKNVGGYVTVRSADGDTDYLWVKPDFSAKGETDKPIRAVLLLDHDVPALALSKNRAETVTAGTLVFDCRVYTPTAFLKLL